MTVMLQSLISGSEFEPVAGHLARNASRCRERTDGGRM
jgi:hypothetical protein